jgi:hypothetical protein
MRADATMCITAHVYPLRCGKNKKNMQGLISPKLVNCRMYVHCREREHEDIDILVDEDPNALAALTQCGLIKKFHCHFMLAQPRILNALVDYWNPDVEAFMLEGQSLTPTIKDIYFLTGLSRRGEPVNFYTFPSGPLNIAELIGINCEDGTKKMGT